jgi:hypothetical protein
MSAIEKWFLVLAACAILGFALMVMLEAKNRE